MPLLRPDARYAHAGFPTKVVESFAVGTPVLANLTSDLGRYLVDGRNGLVCDADSADAVVGTLVRALRLSPGQLGALRTEARRTAERSFDYRAHVGSVAAFLESLRPVD
jgi:glycosyltransferase involved in cell wall biosynthesis